MDDSIDYTPTLLRQDFVIDKVYTVHYFKYGKNFSFKGEKHNFWEIVYSDAGHFGAIAENKGFELRQGEAIFHKPNEYHSVFTGDNVGYAVIISFECLSPAMDYFAGKILMLNEYERTLIKNIVNEYSAAYEGRLDNIYMKQMTPRAHKPPFCDQMIQSQLIQLLISLSRRGDAVAKTERASCDTTTGYKNALVQRIIEFADANIYEGFQLEQLEKHLYFSKTYLKKLFKQQTGTSILQYCLNKKLEEAKKLIAEGNMSFTQISISLGFSSVHYFSRLFKLHTDMTPTEYARSIQVENLL